MAKSAKPAPAAAGTTAKPKSKKLVLIIIGVLILAAGGGGAWYFLKGSKHEEAKVAAPELPTFMTLDPFTVNLQHEEGDQFLQIGITFKVAGMEQADKIRQNLPEIRSRLIFLLSSKHASDLIPLEGKNKLSREIILETNTILGIRPPKAEATSTAASGTDAASATPAEATGSASSKGVQEVLFTSFVIQ